MRKNWTKMRRDRRADIGIGTMIVFIAMVLVAAVAAAVLISTANQVREQATTTGDQAINNVAAGFVRQSVIGTAAGGVITSVVIDLRLAAGSPAVNMANTLVIWTVGAAQETLEDGEFIDAEILSPSEYTYPVVGQGDMFKITINPTASVAALKSVNIQIVPSMGQPCIIDFVTPEYLPNGSIILA